jgi:hypothetical protein
MNNQKVFRTSRWKALLLLGGSALFTWGGMHMIGTRPLIGWATVLFFGACALIGAFVLVKGGAQLRLDEEGFEMIGALKRSQFLWSDIESIRMAKIRGASVIALNYRKGDPRRSQVSRSLAGMDATIGNMYEVSLKELCEALNEWHERYRTAA